MQWHPLIAIQFFGFNSLSECVLLKQTLIINQRRNLDSPPSRRSSHWRFLIFLTDNEPGRPNRLGVLQLCIQNTSHASTAVLTRGVKTEFISSPFFAFVVACQASNPSGNLGEIRIYVWPARYSSQIYQAYRRTFEAMLLGCER